MGRPEVARGQATEGLTEALPKGRGPCADGRTAAGAGDAKHIHEVRRLRRPLALRGKVRRELHVLQVESAGRQGGGEHRDGARLVETYGDDLMELSAERPDL